MAEVLYSSVGRHLPTVGHIMSMVVEQYFFENNPLGYPCSLRIIVAEILCCSRWYKVERGLSFQSI